MKYTERKTIKHYCVPLYENDMDALKVLLGGKTTTQEALAAAVQFSISNMISEKELIQMAENEKNTGGEHGKQDI